MKKKDYSFITSYHIMIKVCDTSKSKKRNKENSWAVMVSKLKINLN